MEQLLLHLVSDYWLQNDYKSRNKKDMGVVIWVIQYTKIL